LVSSGSSQLHETDLSILDRETCEELAETRLLNPFLKVISDNDGVFLKVNLTFLMYRDHRLNVTFPLNYETELCAAKEQKGKGFELWDEEKDESSFIKIPNVGRAANRSSYYGGRIECHVHFMITFSFFASFI